MQEELECGHASVAKARHCLLSVSLSSSRMASSATPEAAPLLPHREGIDKKHTASLASCAFVGLWMWLFAL